jgi:cation diffusion facilitator family transporter
MQQNIFLIFAFLNKANQNLSIQKWVAGISLLLLAGKFFAYYTTHSIAILTDALESIVNVAAAGIGLYSLYVAAKPRDKNHPYGHGKAEFISAAVEGTMIAVAGAIIIYKAIQHLVTPVPLHELDTGIWIVAITALINFILGYYCIRVGKRNDSLALTASGRHLQSDTISTIGIIAGLLFLYFTDYAWIDSVVAMVFALFIIYTGYKILRRSIAGIMDEADEKLLSEMVEWINNHRRDNWIDLHNLRVIKYGSVIHLDCHLTVPWYLNVHEAHKEIDILGQLIRDRFDESMEMFVHSDGCLPFQCHICNKPDCPVRQQPFDKRIEWTLENVQQNQKHQ